MSWFPKKTIVVPVDFSPASADAIKTALQLVAQPSDVHVIHVTQPPVAYAYAEGWALDDPGSRLSAARDHLKAFLEKEAPNVTHLVREGDPGLVISDYAETCHADLIVMPSHGYHGVMRLLLGSVAERVLRHAKCPILVLRRA